MTADAPLITVIVVNYNSGSRLKRCLDALGAQTFKAFEAIVIDNGSEDGSVAEAKTSDHKFTLIEAGDNLGFAVANNRAAERAKGDWLAFLNPDAYPEPDWLAALVAAAEKYEGVDAFGSTQIDAGDTTKLDGAGDVFHACGLHYRGHYGKPVSDTPPDGECFAPCAAAAMYRRSTFGALGGFEESFFCYAEDIDLGFRLRLSGGRSVQLAGAHVLHEGSGVTGKLSPFSIYYGHRNRIWAYYRNAPLILLIATAPLQILANIALGFRFAAVGGLGPYLRAMRDGYGGLSKQMAARRRIQKMRRCGVVEISKAMTWSPFKLLRRQADLRPIGR